MRRIVVALALFLAAPAFAAEPTVDALVEDLRRVAFHDELGNGRMHSHLRRFEDPVRVSIQGSGAAADVALVRDVVALAAKHTGHDIRLAEAGEEANFFVYLSQSGDAPAVAQWMAENQTRYKGRLKNALLVPYFEVHARSGGGGPGARGSCFAFIVPHDGRPDLEYAHAFVNLFAPADQKRRCIAEEILQALGLTGDTKKDWPSIFSNSRVPEQPSAYDLEYLRVLYDRRLRSGLTPAQALPLMRQIYGELRAGALPAPESLPRPDPLAFVPANELILKTFLDAAFRRLGVAPRDRFLIAAPPLRFSLFGSVLTQHRTQFVSLIDKLRLTIGLDIDVVKQGEDLQFVVFVEEGVDVAVVRRELNDLYIAKQINAHRNTISSILDERKNSKEMDIDQYIRLPKSYLIRSGLHLHNQQRARKLNHSDCFAKSILSVLGPTFTPFVPIDTSFFSVWSVCPDKPTAYDFLLLRLLFDERLKPGMTLPEAEAAARLVLTELRPDETTPPELVRLRLPLTPANN